MCETANDVRSLSVFQNLIVAFRADTSIQELQAQLESVDQDALAISAIVLGLAPLLHQRLAEANVAVAPRALAKLAAARETARLQHSERVQQLAQLLTALSAQEITPMLLKGSHLAASVYAEPALRQMNDIDLLVQAQDLPRTEAALLGLGYIGSFKSAERGAGVTKHTSTFRPPRADDPTPNPYLSSSAGRTVEPHTSLEESWYGLRADITPGVWERSVIVQVNEHTARGLSADDLALHLAVHLTFHLIMGYPSMVQLMDVLFVTARMREQIHWDVVVQRAIERRAAAFVYAALHLATRTLAAPIPHTALEALARACPAGVRAYAEKITLENVASRTQRAPVTTFAQRLQRGWEERAEVARWTSTLPDRWRVWRTMLDVANTDTGGLAAQQLRGVFKRAKNNSVRT